jgi:multimeric flavodoxin WrbA
MIAILSDGKKQEVGRRLYEKIVETGREAVYVSLEDKHILPCKACSSCSGPTFGRCVLKDDMKEIMAVVEKSSAWVLVSPVSFGGHSATAKTAQDRLTPLGDPRYYVENGELVKGWGRGTESFYAVGVAKDLSQKERDVFLNLHRENVRIMNCGGSAFVVEESPDVERLQNIVEVLIRG